MTFENTVLITSKVIRTKSFPTKLTKSENRLRERVRHPVGAQLFTPSQKHSILLILLTFPSFGITHGRNSLSGGGGGISCQQGYLLPMESVISDEVRSVHSSRAWREGGKEDLERLMRTGVDRG